MPTDYTVNAYFLGNLDDDAGKEGSPAVADVITLTDVNDNGRIGEGEDLLGGDLIENLNDQSTLDLESAGVVTGWYIEIELDDGSKDVFFVPTDGTVPEDDVLAEDVDLGGDQAGDVEDLAPVVPCFTKGTLIQTKRGEIPVELIRPGDKVITRDNGFQTVRWVGQRDLAHFELKASHKLRPIQISRGSLGKNLPESDLVVSPNHRILIHDRSAQLYFNDPEVLVAAKHLLRRPGIRLGMVQNVCYVHIMFDKHELVRADGAWTESFCPGPQILKGFPCEQREELFSLFPELRHQSGRLGYELARQEIKKRHVVLLEL